MWNHILSALVLAALVGTFASAPSPAPMPRSVVARTVPSQPAAASQDIAGALAGGSGLQVRQPPIPLVRNLPALPPNYDRPRGSRCSTPTFRRRAIWT